MIGPADEIGKDDLACASAILEVARAVRGFELATGSRKTQPLRKAVLHFWEDRPGGPRKRAGMSAAAAEIVAGTRSGGYQIDHGIPFNIVSGDILGAVDGGPEAVARVLRQRIRLYAISHEEHQELRRHGLDATMPYGGPDDALARYRAAGIEIVRHPQPPGGATASQVRRRGSPRAPAGALARKREEVRRAIQETIPGLRVGADRNPRFPGATEVAGASIMLGANVNAQQQIVWPYIGFNTDRRDVRAQLEGRLHAHVELQRAGAYLDDFSDRRTCYIKCEVPFGELRDLPIQQVAHLAAEMIGLCGDGSTSQEKTGESCSDG